ncbi:MAG: hypothetical protein OEX97_14095, partial [Acidimicrobiia bacterium]|nr:hypothetical protein [Acidimicrobiia bacterium]
ETSRDPIKCDIDAVVSIIDELGAEERKPMIRTAGLCEFDLWADISDLATWRDALERTGLSHFRPHRRMGHRFFIGFGSEGWVKVDVKLRNGDSGRLLGDLAWLLRRRRGMVVALLGADGSGKSTAVTCVERSLPIDAISRYLGTKPRSRPDDRESRRSSLPFRSYLGLVKWIPRIIRQLWSLEAAARRGTVVICDRHPIEAGRLGAEPPLVKVAKRVVVRFLAPRPDLVILLDAPGELLYARKGEHSPEHLNRMTETWRQVMRSVDGVSVSAELPAEDVCHRIQEQIWIRLADRRAC